MPSDQYLEPTYFIDSDSEPVIQFAKNAAGDATDPVEQAVKLYLAVRDKIYYTPYGFELTKENMKASTLVKKGAGFCIPKAVLLAAVARVMNIPSRLGLADVKNHLSTKKFRELMGTDIFLYHGYTELLLENQWVKATPAFNLSLCEKFQVKPLDFNGREDSIFHEFNQAGHKHMEYIKDYGTFQDLPYESVNQVLTDNYPKLIALSKTINLNQFEKEAEQE